MKDENSGITIYGAHLVDEGITDKNGNPVQSVDIWSYCSFFAENIQDCYDTEDGKVFEGINLWDYAKRRWEPLNLKFCNELVTFSNDKTLVKLQKVMEKYGILLNAWALGNLALFIIDIIRHQFAIKLRPSARETLDEIEEAERMEFVMKNGSRSVTNNQRVIETIKESLRKQCEGETVYETDEFVRLEEVTTREYPQMWFFFYMEQFLQKMFPIKRGARGNASLLNEEYDLIGYMMRYFKLSPVEVTMARMRQLRMAIKKGLWICPLQKLPFGKNGIYLNILFLKYSAWSKGRINPLKDEIPELEVGDTVRFSPDIKGLELLKE